MPEGRFRLLVAGGDRERARQFVDWAPERYLVDSVVDGEAVPQAATDVDVLLLAGVPDGRPLDLLVRAVRNAGADCRILAVLDEDPDLPEIDEVLAPPLERATFRSRLADVEKRLVYDDCLEEYYEVATERGRLEARKSRDELEDDEEYVHLQHRSRRLRTQVDDLLPDAPEDGYETMFRDLFPGSASG